MGSWDLDYLGILYVDYVVKQNMMQREYTELHQLDEQQWNPRIFAEYACREFTSFMKGSSSPPEAYADASPQSAHIVPPPNRNVKALALMENRLHIISLLEPGPHLFPLLEFNGR